MRFLRARIWVVVFLVMTIPLAACSESNREIPTPDIIQPVPFQTQEPTCVMPFVAGMDAKIAEDLLRGVGLGFVQAPGGFNSQIPAGSVLASEPPGGMRLAPCKLEVKLLISQGPEPTVVLPTTPAATAVKISPTATLPALDSASLPSVTYFEDFSSRQNGFHIPAWKVKAGAGSNATEINGFLTVQSQVEAFTSETNWPNSIRISLAAVSMYPALRDFSVYTNYRDAKNYLRMGCSMLEPGVGRGLFLSCSWFEAINGLETQLKGVGSPEVCTGVCSLVIEIKGSTYRVFADQVERMRFTNTTFDRGGVGLRIIAAGDPLRMDALIVYELSAVGIPGKTLFRDDFGGDWATGTFDSDEATSILTTGNGVYRWQIRSRKAINFRQLATPPVTLPEHFLYTVDVRRVGGLADAGYGVLFRAQDNGNLYSFIIRDSGTFAIYSVKKNALSAIVEPTTVGGIKAGQTNRLVVSGAGSTYRLSINGTVVYQFTDVTGFKGGSAGLVVDMNAPGLDVTVEFELVQVEIP